MQDPFHSQQRLYFLPIGGTAMASLAGLLQASGHRVEGVDAALYPPMSTLLEELAIRVRLGYDPARLPTEVDRVIVGNAVGRDNPEVVAVLERRLPFLSQAEAVAHYLLAEGRRGLVVAGTHGKTTTTAMLAFILEQAATDPTVLVGGIMSWCRRSFRRGRGPWLVIEGDEYNTAFFDRAPKFLHYRPELFVLGPVELDHTDIYRDLDAVLTAFRAGTAQVPKHGAVIVGSWSEAAVAATRDTTAPVLTVGPAHDAFVRLHDYQPSGEGGEAELVVADERLRLALPLAGEHNARNAAMAVAAAVAAGVEAPTAVAALARFPGVARRLERVGEAGGVLVVDDFAHHPTAVAATIAAARTRWPGRRLVVAFEPRSLSAARAVFEDAYAAALAEADVALVAPPFHRGRLDADQRLDRGRLGRRLAERGVEAIMPPDDADPVAALVPHLVAGDVVVGCSSGSFGGFHRRLLERIAGRAHGEEA